MRILNCKTDEIIGPEEYMERVERDVDPRDGDSVCEAARLLQKLANNRNVLIEAVNKNLERLSRRAGASTSSASLVIGHGNKTPWFLRANIWPPMGATSTEIERSIFSYEGVHDHNFSFLTANVLGPGYSTDVWQNLSWTGSAFEAGAKVDLVYQGRFDLAPFTQMYYEFGRDVHLQIPPSGLTVSINLMFNDPEVRIRPQHNFDPVNGISLGYSPGTMLSRRVELIRMASRIGNFETLSILQSLSGWPICKATSREAELASEFLKTHLN